MNFDLIYFTLWKIIEIVFGKDAREERFFNAKGYLIYYIVGSVIGMIVQPVFGLLSDNCSFRKGKRRVMMFLGIVIVTLFGIGFIVCSFVFDETFNEKEKQISDINQMIVMFIFSMGVIFGLNIIQVMNRAFLLDLVDYRDIKKGNLYLASWGNLVKTLFCFIAIFCFSIGDWKQNLKAYDILSNVSFILGIIILWVAFIIICIGSEETELMSSRLRDSISDVFEALKQLSKDFFTLLAVYLFGYIALAPLTSSFGRYFGTYYEDCPSDEFYTFFQHERSHVNYKHIDILTRTYSYFTYSFFAYIYSFIQPFIARKIGEIETFICTLTISSFACSFLALPELTTVMNDKSPCIYSPIYPIIFFAFIGPSFVEIISLPYALLQKAVSPDQYGVFCGLLNLAVVFAQLLTTMIVSGFLAMFDFMTVWTFLWFIFFAIIACCVSIALKKMTERVSLNVNPRFV